MFCVQLGKKKFEVIGIADIAKKKAYFQAVVNEVPVFQDEDYEFVREFLISAIALNQPEKQEGVQ